MDFIERWFHISPDGGNGTFEGLYIGGFLVMIVIMAIRFRHRLTELFIRYLEQLGKRDRGDRFDS